MGLFRRKKKTIAEAAPNTPEDGVDAGASADTASGPYDIADAPDEQRIDFGAIQVTPRDGMQISLEMEQRSRRVSGLTLSLLNSAAQVNAFAAPKSAGLWDEVRKSLRASITEQGGTTETREGSFGTELHARLPLPASPDSGPKYRPVRFVGIDGPRWFIRAVISGAALHDNDACEEIEKAIRSLVIVRGTTPMAPKEVIELTVPHDATPDEERKQTAADLDPAGQGPSIAITN